MPHFRDHYSKLRYPLETLRRAQVGALHAIGAHFTIREDPALVAMPTGTGKTLVLSLAPFLTQALHVLVVTQGRLVRGQIADELKTLRTARILGAIIEGTPEPSVYEIEERIQTPQEWEALRPFDVVVATPQSISPGLEDVPAPPPDLFDLVLIDEAHHTPASTWSAVMQAFPNAKQILFTATPYRRDHKEIKATIIYSYPIKLAYDEGVFGHIRYIPVQPARQQPPDVAVAIATEHVFQQDRAAGLQHAVMVRTDSKKRAGELKTLYEQHTNLRLPVVHSGLSFNTIKKTIERLRAGTLDGVICVDMMSEGFDFPNLKIAAIHIPHRSLEVTLQFIGRFARTNAEHIGEAKFLAIPEQIQGETSRLYAENAVWEELIVDLTEQRLTAETNIRETLEKFEPPILAEEKTEELSLYALWPYFHVKIYGTPGPVEITQPLTLPLPFTVVYQRNAPELSAAVVIGNERQAPRWTDLDAFKRSEYELFIIYWDVAAQLLFICSSRRTDAIYEAIAKQYTGGSHKILPLWKITRVLRRLENPDFFSLGMKNRLGNSNTESYRHISGPRAQLAVDKSDGRLYHRGHVFGKGMVDEQAVTIGYSSASKVWSNRTEQLAELIAWCKTLGANIHSHAPVPEHEGLKFLAVGAPIEEFPEALLAVDWPVEAYRTPLTIHYRDEHGHAQTIALLDAELRIVNRTQTRLLLGLAARDTTYHLHYDLGTERYFSPVQGADDEFTIEHGKTSVGFIDYLNSNLLTIYTGDFSSITGAEIFETDPTTFAPFDQAHIVIRNWTGVNIEKEFWKADEDHQEQSIHERLLADLENSAAETIIYDHRTGEVADVITIETRNQKTHIAFYHVKGSSAPRAGQRVGDTYEVCGQIVKSVIYINDLRGLIKKLERRIDTGSELRRGTIDGLRQQVEHGRHHGCTYELVVVQPGLTAALTPANHNVLAAAQDYARRAGTTEFHVFASAHAEGA